MSKKSAKVSSISTTLTKGFLNTYPGEAAQLVNDVPVGEALQLLSSMPISTVVTLMQRLNPHVAAQIAEEMERDLFVGVFSAIDPGQGVLLLARLERNMLNEKLDLLPESVAREYREILAYPPDSAGSLMDPRVVVYHLDDTVKQVLERIRTVGERRIVDIAVVDDTGKLVAQIPLQTIAVSPPKTKIRELIERQPVSIEVLSPREDVVQLLDARKLTSLPVVDVHGKLVGIIRYDSLVSAAQQEASENVQAMFGAGKDEQLFPRFPLP